MDETASTQANRLYAAALDNEGWDEALGAVAQAFRADMAMLMVVDMDQGRPQRADALAFTNIAPDALSEYGRDFARHDPWMQVGTTRLKPLQALRLDEVVPAETFVHTPRFRHIASHGIAARHALGGRFEDLGADSVAGAISLMRYASSGRFEASAERLLEALLPHVQRAAAAHARLHGPGLVLAHASEALGQAVAVLDSTGRVLAMNPAFQRLVSDGWFVRDLHGLAPADGGAAPGFASLVGAAATCAAGGTATQAGGEVTLRNPLRPGVLVARVLPQTRPHPAALVVVHDPARTRPPMAATLRNAFGLTCAETALAQALSAGETLAGFAARRGVGLPTVKSQLAALFGKTDTSRQAALVRRLASFGG
jgi:PAS domain-containing protein/DNA-binding CsgD family transcriptional regulator